MTSKRKNIVILGAGLAGLYFAYKNIHNSQNMTIIEEESQIGGLAKTINYKKFKFDLGGHRFTTDKTYLLKEFKKILGKDIIKIKRKSKIYLNKKLIDYPLKISILKDIKLKTLIKIGIENLIKPKNKKHVNFEEDIKNRFGKTLFKIYFKDYTRKVVGIDCKKLSADWSKSRIQNLNYWLIFKGLISKSKDTRTYIDTFYYPKYGIGMLCNNLSKKIANKAKIIKNAKIKKIKYKNNMITSLVLNKNKEIYIDELVSTIPLNKLLNLLKLEHPPKLAKQIRYRSLILVFLAINKEKITDNHWIYFPDKDIVFGRLHEPKNWSKYLCPNKKSALCLEIFCNENDKTWKRKDKDIIDGTILDLEKTSFVKKSNIVDTKLIRVKNAYPIYQIGYKEKCKGIYELLKKFRNLKMIGRTGKFDYINMDQVMNEITKLQLPQK